MKNSLKITVIESVKRKLFLSCRLMKTINKEEEKEKKKRNGNKRYSRKGLTGSCVIVNDIILKIVTSGQRN